MINFAGVKASIRWFLVGRQHRSIGVAACLVAALGFGLPSCSKKITVPEVTPAAAALNIEEIDFEYFSGKAKINFKDDKKEREVKANIRIRKDSVIWMTFSVVGVQGGKALINRDSITVVSTIDKEYFVFTYDELSRRFNFPISYEVIQAAALGNLIRPRQVSDAITTDMSYSLLSQSEGSVSIRNFINIASAKLERVELRESQTQNTLNIDYSNFQVVGPKVFPYNGTISIVYKTLGGLINNTIVFEYSKAEVGDKELKFPFNIPRKYDRR